MVMSELPTFMAAMRHIQSGSLQGNYGLARGAYGISNPNWTRWIEEAGLSGAPVTAKAAQDAVAKFKMGQLYRRYGDWRLVGIAWLDGTNAADTARKQGIGAWKNDTDRLVRSMHSAANAGYGKYKPPSSITQALDSQARDSIERGTLSVDKKFSPDTPDVGSSYRPPTNVVRPMQQQTVLTQQQQATAPEPAKQNPLTKDRLAQSEMHRNMSAILQGLSNAIRKGTTGFAENASVLSEDQREGLS
jgi:hypothetical protein